MTKEYRRTIVKIPNGDQEAEANITIPSGDKIYVLATDGGINPSSLVSLKIDENGREIHPYQSHKVYDGQIGSFAQRAIELNREDGGDFTVKAKSTKNVTSDVFIEVNFMVQKDEECEK